MARPARLAVEDQPAAPRTFAPLPPEPEPDQTQLGAEASHDSFSSIPEWATAAVYRVWPPVPGRPSIKPAYCGTLTCPAVPDDVARQWGGGVFDLIFNKANGQRAGHKRLAIDGDPIWSRREPPKAIPMPGDPPAAPAPSAQPSTPTPDAMLLLLLGRLEAMDARISAIAAGSGAQPVATASMIEQMTSLAKLMREMSGTPSLDPALLVKWFQSGFNARGEIADGGGDRDSGGDSTGGMIAQAVTRYLDYLDRREGRRIAVARARGLAAPPKPTTIEKQLPTPERPPGVRADDVAEAHAPIPQWALNVARELARAQKSGDEPDYTAAFIIRNVPAPVVTRFRTIAPSVAVGEIMALAPLVARAGVRLSEEFVQGIVRELRLEEEEIVSPTIATAAPAEPAPPPTEVQLAPATAAPAPVLGTVSLDDAGDEDGDDDEEDFDDEDDDEDFDEDDDSDEDFDDEDDRA